MAYEQFIMITLSLTPDQIQSLSTVIISAILYIRVTLKCSSDIRCPYCGGKATIHGYSTRTYNHLPISGYPSVIEWKRRRFACKDCRSTFMEPNPFGPETYHQTYGVLDSIAKDLHNVHFSFKDIAQKHHISDSLVQLYADSFLRVPRLTLPESLGIDELHSNMAKYGGSYIAVLADNVHRSLLDILPNRSKRHLSKYFEQIPQAERERVRFVTIDLWEPYKDTAEKYLPNCVVCADPFHVVKHLSEGFSRIRIDIMNHCVYDSPEYYLLKTWHKLLESDYYLDNEPKYNNFFKAKMNYRELYNLLLNLNPDLTLAYQLKEMYRDFNRNCSYEEAPQQLDQLIQVFEEANLYCYAGFIETLKTWKPQIINSFQRPFDNRKQSNALTEHLNSRLRELISISNGFANFDRFRARAVYCLNDYAYYALTDSLRSSKRKGKSRGSYNKKKDHLLEDDPNNSIDTMNSHFE